MLSYALGIVGAIWGARVAKKRGGNRADMAQYAVGYGLAAFLIAYLVLLIADRLI